MFLDELLSQKDFYFLTSSVIDEVEVFSKPVYKSVIVSSLHYCQQHKGLELYGWVLLNDRLHWIASTRNGYCLSDILRDFKKFTSKEILQLIHNEAENKKDWMLHRFEYAGHFKVKIKNYKFWNDGNQNIKIRSSAMFYHCLAYIHYCPVSALIVTDPVHYLYSSARNYAGMKGLLDITRLPVNGIANPPRNRRIANPALFPLSHYNYLCSLIS